MTVIDQVLGEINEVMGKVDEAQLSQAEALIQKDKRIFVLGAGRSGLMAKGFAMRLMHIAIRYLRLAKPSRHLSKRATF